MTRTKSLLRLVAVAGAVLLVAGFISYRAGAFDWLKPKPAREPADPKSTIISGSKSLLGAFPED